MKKYTYYFFIIITYLFLFQNFLEKNISPIFGYYDEAYALLIIPTIVAMKKDGMIKKIDLWIIVDIFVFNVLAIVSSSVNKIQIFSQQAQDFVIVNKFIFSLWTSKILFRGLLNDNNKNKILKHCKIITVVYALLIGIDYFFHIFSKKSEIRYGIRAAKLFYSHPTYLCAILIFILALMIMCRNEGKKDIKFYIIISICIALTLRIKAIIFIVIFWTIYILILNKNKKLKLKVIAVIGVIAFLIGESQFEYYFVDNESARSTLLTTSFSVANDYFPLGAGLATYGSSSSISPYSVLYSKYGLSHRYGLTRKKPSFISDNFWPMIIGQFGYIGLVCYITFLYLLYKRIQNIYSSDISLYVAALIAYIYPIIMSTSVSAFVAPTAIPLAVVIGLCIGNADRIHE